MNTVKKYFAPVLVLAAFVLAVAVSPVSAADGTAPAGTEPDVTMSGDELDDRAEHIAIFSADGRVDGVRLDEEAIFAFVYDEAYPFEASLWALEDEANDEWFPVCIGFLEGDDDEVVFVGGSTLGDDDDGCVIVGLGDDSGVLFAAVEIWDDSVYTAAMYVIG